VFGIHLIQTDEINRIGKCSIVGVDTKKKSKGIGTNLWEQSLGIGRPKNRLVTVLFLFHPKTLNHSIFI
jgi:hypothetical protein